LRLLSQLNAVREMRKHAAWYLKGLHGNGKIRDQINQFKTRDDVANSLYKYVDELETKVGVS
ncbi:MAG TPA: tRNA dihydrouridine synthase DusB, partial [Bacilli bacterium]|nr:tRNA dihydrouridine synthase DusB [Bacilli bacterium]